MNDIECAETLSEFRKLNIGPEFAAALDHAIGRLRPVRDLSSMARALGPLVTDHGSGVTIAGGGSFGVLMNGHA